jgi:hypothetical protein
MKDIKIEIRHINHILSFDEINVYGDFYNSKDSPYKFGDKILEKQLSNKIDLYYYENNKGIHLSQEYKEGCFAGCFVLYSNHDRDYDNIEELCYDFTSMLRRYNHGKLKEVVIYEDGKEVFVYDNWDEFLAISKKYQSNSANVTVIEKKLEDNDRKEWVRRIKNQWRKTSLK